MRIISRLFSAAFDVRETVEDRFFVECTQCPNAAHAVLNGVETEEERADFQMGHHNETGHTQYAVYRMQRVAGELMLPPLPSIPSASK